MMRKGERGEFIGKEIENKEGKMKLRKEAKEREINSLVPPPPVSLASFLNSICQ